MVYLDTNIFLFLLFIFLNLIFLFFWFPFSFSWMIKRYMTILSLLNQFWFVIEHRKSEVFYFSRLHRIFNLLSLNLSLFGGSILHSKDTWRYLGFIFDRELSFWQQINFYFNKALSIVKYMKMLGNSTRGFLPHQKWLLYSVRVEEVSISAILLHV